jgi:stage II sporulation protein B
MKKSSIARKKEKKLKQQATDHVDASHSEPAAALQESSEEEPIPVLTKEDSNSKNKSGNSTGFRRFKPIIIAIVSAVVIGSVLGFVMLRMFVGIDHELAAPDPNSSPNPVVNANGDKQQTEAKPVKLEAMNAYVLQGGVFAEQANADEWVDKFADAGMPSMVWKQDKQYYLFLGMAADKEQAKGLIATMKESSDLDVFVKEWKTDKMEVKMSGDEQKWYQSFQDQWTKSLSNVNKEKAIAPEDWKQIAADYPKNSKRGDALVKEMSQIKEVTGTEAQVVLLNLWNAFNQSMK